jgi:hypothetical protein
MVVGKLFVLSMGTLLLSFWLWAIVGASKKKESTKATPKLCTLRKIPKKQFCRFKPF